MKKWKCLKSELVLDTKHFKVRKDTLELPSGDKHELIYWDSGDSAMVIGMVKDRKLIMICQYRYLVGDEVIEFPAGMLNENERAENGAKREFEEETGFRCESLIKLGSFYETYGHLNRKIHLFFSNQVTESKQMLDAIERFQNTKVKLVDFDEAVKLALENRMAATASTLAILLLKEKIDRGEIVIK